MGLHILFGLVYKALTHVLYTSTNAWCEHNIIIHDQSGSTQLLAMLKLDDSSATVFTRKLYESYDCYRIRSN